jgi:glutamate formiminotransferase/formiminotetrahydrofolate cyclodeaminase
VLQGAAEILGIAEKLTRIGAPTALSDVGVSAMAALAAAQGAYDNVLINLPDLTDASRAAELRARAERFLEEAREISSRVRRQVDDTLRASAS